MVDSERIRSGSVCTQSVSTPRTEIPFAELHKLEDLGDNWVMWFANTPNTVQPLRISLNLAEASTQCCYMQFGSCSSVVGPMA